MNDYLDRQKVLDGIDGMIDIIRGDLRDASDLEWADGMIRHTGCWDPDPIILGDGSAAKVGDRVINWDKGVYTILAASNKWVWIVGETDLYASVVASQLKALPEPDTRDKIETDAARIVSELCLSMGAEKDFLALLDRAFALAAVTE
jgi:hypothetical protein